MEWGEGGRAMRTVCFAGGVGRKTIAICVGSASEWGVGGGTG